MVRRTPLACHVNTSCDEKTPPLGGQFLDWSRKRYRSRFRQHRVRRIPNSAKYVGIDGRAEPNTGQLTTSDGDVGGVLGLWPVSMRGAFDVPFGHFAFDDPWCGSAASVGVESIEDSADECLPVPVRCARVVRGKKRPAGRRTGARCAVRQRN